ncbi:MAG TPA: flagellar motor switch protein FliN [Chloroflexota bacterium]|nr:flagellar motor switch protein FliN [Chloroflexota bacterium]
MAEKAVASGDVGTIGGLNAGQTDKLVEFGRGLLQSALEALGTTLDKKLDAEGAAHMTGTPEDIGGMFPGMFVVIEGNVRMEDGSSIPTVLLLGEDDGTSLFNVSADGAGEDEYKAKMEESVQTTVTDLTDFLTLSVSVNSNAQLQFGVDHVELRNLAMAPLELPAAMGGEILSVQLPLTVDGGPAMDVTYLASVDSLGQLLSAVDPSAAPAMSSPAPSAPAPSAPRPAATVPATAQPMLSPLPTGHQEQRDAVVRPAQFTSFPAQGEGSSMANIDLILDVQLRVTVELGRKLMSVRDILALGPGSVVELDKVAGEPVDVLVNDRLIATGEVVVADDNFGVRITDIVNPAKRLSSR